jgi:hypothetical protein
MINANNSSVMRILCGRAGWYLGGAGAAALWPVTGRGARPASAPHLIHPPAPRCRVLLSLLVGQAIHRAHTPGARCQVPGARCQVPGARCQVSGASVPGASFLVSGARC